MGTLEAISDYELGQIGDELEKIVRKFVEQKGYHGVGGAYGGGEYAMYYKRDSMDIFGREEPISLKLRVPYTPPENARRKKKDRELWDNRWTCSEIRNCDRRITEDELLSVCDT